MTGTIVTFYSYKGGVGRSLALANAAAVLARWGYRVLCIDWDLDAPGLSFYFRPWIPAEAEAGLVDLVARHAAGEIAEPRRYTVPVDLPGVEGRLDLLPAGSGQDRYVRQVQDIDWAVLYERHGFGAFLERCRAEWTNDYDFVLVDSRTGITTSAGSARRSCPRCWSCSSPPTSRASVELSTSPGARRPALRPGGAADRARPEQVRGARAVPGGRSGSVN
jgi:MinD-like ATPase involved in chromosome partitioning or flagellar assembly